LVLVAGGASGTTRGRIVSHNQAFGALLGGELVGLTLDRVAPEVSWRDAHEGRGPWRDLRGRAFEAEWRSAALSEGMQLLVVRSINEAFFTEAIETLRRAHRGLLSAGGLCVDLTGEIVYRDATAARLLGGSEGGAEDRSLLRVERGLDLLRWEARVRGLEVGHAAFETTFEGSDGGPLEVSVVSDRVSRGTASYVVLLFREAGTERSLRSAFGDIASRFDLVTAGARDGLWVWDMLTGEVEYSARWSALVGEEDKRRVGSIDMWLERVHPADRPGVDAALGAHMDGYAPSFESEHRIEHRAGTWRWVSVRGVAERDGSGRLRRMAGSMSDIAHRRNAEERLRYETYHDGLTGLANRTALIQRLHDALQDSRTTNDHLGLLLIDIDGFRLVNDSFGLSLGDLLLRGVASRLSRTVRAADMVARTGGDEFVVILEGLESPDRVEQVAERIARELCQPFDLRGYAVYSSAAIGIVKSGLGYTEPEELLRDANIALLRARRAGRNQRRVFDRTMRHETIRRLMLETDLRRALDRGELSLDYQPILSLQTGALMGFEALCRWRHGKHGLIGPSEFIPIAEETGLIMPIGRWALETACDEALSWGFEGLPCEAPWVSVNVSGRQLAQPDFVEEVGALLGRAGLPPERLRLEITESVLMENAETSRERLEALTRLGVGLSIDDFGTGYSSLAYLRRFPIQTLKIDRAFLSRESDSDESWAIVDTIRSLAKTLGLRVIVEGVETEEHLARLRAMGCEAGQGYLMARPIHASEIRDFMSSCGHV
jgi:diguanylate cyclase (GGDEF)-like protein/PAS domain S-box-containing protein